MENIKDIIAAVEAAEKHADAKRDERMTIAIRVSEYRELLKAEAELRTIKGIWRADKDACWRIGDVLAALYPDPPVVPEATQSADVSAAASPADDTHPPHGEHNA